MNPHRSKEDLVFRISKSVFVTNFPANYGPHDLWTLCETYGKVVDVFILNRLSKAGKRFAFVLFIKVDDMERLIGNLRILWVGRLHIHPNVVPVKDLKSTSRSSVLNLPTLVLDDTCVNDIDLSRFVMGNVKELNSIPNLQIVLAKEGFVEIKPSYLGGLWVLLELPNVESKSKLLQHTGVKSWFDVLQDANSDFICDERIVWVDIEGIPLKVWSHATFAKNGKKWDEVMEIEESPGANFTRKRLCIKTSRVDNILETFKVTYKGKVFMARAKELFTWTPCFLELKDEEYNSDDESVLDANIKLVNLQQNNDSSDDECNVEKVSDTIFRDIPSSPCSKMFVDNAKEASLHSEDPFKVYDMLRNPGPRGGDESHVCGVRSVHFLSLGEQSPAIHLENKFSPLMSNVNEDSCDFSTSMKSNNTCNGGSILGMLDEMIKVGKSMGYDIKGCSNDIERIIGLQGADEGSHCSDLCSAISFAKRTLWDYISGLISRWKGETIVMGDFNVMEGYAFTWSHPSTTKMSKLDRFLVSKGIVSAFPNITAVCLDRHLSDHRPILFNEISSDFGLTPFRIYHSWFKMAGFNDMVEQTWNSFSHSDSNRLIRFKKKLQDLKKVIRIWVRDYNASQLGSKRDIIDGLVAIDKKLDNGITTDDMLLKRMELSCKLHELKQSNIKDVAQKAKIKWAIKGDENSKVFHGIINKRRSQLSIRGVFVNGDWRTGPSLVKDAFLDHFASRFKQPDSARFKLNISFHNQLSSDQSGMLDMNISKDEIKAAVWDCGENKSFGPDGFTFEFFKRYWNLIGFDFCLAVECFFESGMFPNGCNSSFIALIPKVTDAKFVNDFRPISLIGSVYKVVSKILAKRLAVVISEIVSNTQSAFISNRQILDGPFILNEVFSWCKRKKKQALVFKVDFAKAYDSVRWDFLLDVLHAFGFGPRWCMWVRDDAVFIGEWSDANLKNLITIFNCFHLPSGLRINVKKSQVMGVGVPLDIVNQGAALFGCEVLQTPFKYLGVTVEDNMSRYSSWTNTIQKVHARLSKWKCHILREIQSLTLKGFDFLSHCKIRVRNGNNTRFWLDKWVSNIPLCVRFPRIFALELVQGSSVAAKWEAISFDASFRRHIRNGAERHQWLELLSLLDSVVLSSSVDRWFCDLRDGDFRVKEIRTVIDDLLLPSVGAATRWVKHVPIKVNIFAWRARLDRLQTRGNLVSRGVGLESSLCPVCNLMKTFSMFSLVQSPASRSSTIAAIVKGLSKRDTEIIDDSTSRGVWKDQCMGLTSWQTVNNLDGGSNSFRTRRRSSGIATQLQTRTTTSCVDDHHAMLLSTAYNTMTATGASPWNQTEASGSERLKGIMIGNTSLIINKSKFIKGESKGLVSSDFPPIRLGLFIKHVSFNTNKGSSFKDAVTGRKMTAKNFHVLQNAWDVICNSGLDECNVKYVRDLSLVFEWKSKEDAIKSLDVNKVWLQQWFDDLKMWDENCDSYGRLTWLHVEGLPLITRSLGAVKKMLTGFRKILEVGQLDYDSKVLSPVKALVLTYNMGNIYEALNVKVNGKPYSVRVFKEQFVASSLISPVAHSSDDDRSTFEEEVVGPSLFGGRDDKFPDNLALEPKDKGLDDLISSFNRLSQNKSQVLKVAKRRNKGKKTKLYVGEPSFAYTSAPVIEDKKKSWVRSMIGKDSPSLLGIQKTKMENIDLMLARSLWPRDNMDFAFSNSMGASGGILSIWNSSVFALEHKVVERNLLGILGRWAGISRRDGFVNVLCFKTLMRFVLTKKEWDLPLMEQRLNSSMISLLELALLTYLRRWDVKGDENSRYFHSTLKHNYAKSSINRINVNGVWVVDPDDLKSAALEHFALRFKENIVCRLKFKSSRVRKLSSPDASFLDSPFSINEIKSAVWECDGSNASGPDGFNFKFIKTYWDVIKDVVVNCVKYFETSGKLAAGCNPSFIVFIPMSRDPVNFSDYLPISLIGCVYKIISKVLALRLARVISSVISPNQTAFIVGRQILDGCLIDNEIIRMAKLEGHKLLLFKVDFEKAFDSVRACLSSALISVLINGSPSKEFKMEMGLRQEDPLFPLLFLLVGEALQVAILKAWSSSLKVNISKSRIFGIGVPNADVDQVVGSLGYAFNQIPFMYLSLPMGKSMRSCGGWNGVVDMFNARLSSWNAKNLSIGGGLTLVKSVLAFKHSSQLKIFNGSNTLFWKDHWCGNEVRLKDLFPRLYVLENDQDCNVKERWCLSDGVWGMGGNWNWRFAPRGRAVSDLNTLLFVIGDYALDGSRNDSWTWIGDVSRLFKVKPLATYVQNSLFSGCDLGKHHLWNALVPRKVNICVWRASLNRLPTRLNLSSHIGHCLISCPKVVPVWRKIEVGGVCPRPLTFLLSLLKILPSGRSDPIVVLRRVRFCMGRFNVRCGLYGSGGTKR
nr:RNA-directed DNA polymerase, eukaryota [Tanacetum cinerariifolium]